MSWSRRVSVFSAGPRDNRGLSPQQRLDQSHTPKGPAMQSISCILLEVREKSIKITDGTAKDFTDRETGELTKRPVWYFLPRSQIAIDGVDMTDDDSLQGLLGKTIELEAEEWLLKEKGLI